MPTEQRFAVGTAVAQPGQWSTGALTLGYFPDGPVTTAVNILCGEQPGPTLWVQSAIHGTETGGAIGLLRLFERLDPARMKGAIIGVMAANPLAFRAYGRNTPIDGENLNRLFPGDPDGATSRQMASTLFETALGVADAAMDLHSGGNEAIVPFYALYWDDGTEASREAGRLAHAAGTPVIWASRDAWLTGALYTNFTKRGKPGIIVECGGGGPLPESDIANFATAIEGVAQGLGIVPGEPLRQPSYRTLTSCELVFNRMGGYVLPKAQAGDTVQKGDVIATIMDPHGRIVEELTAPAGPAYIAAMTRPYLPVHSGAMIAECAPLAAAR